MQIVIALARPSQPLRSNLSPPCPTKAAHVGRSMLSSAPRQLPLQFASGGGSACLVGRLSLLHPHKANSININSGRVIQGSAG